MQQVQALPPQGIPVVINSAFRADPSQDPFNFRIALFSNLAFGKAQKYLCYVHHVAFRNYISIIRANVNDTFTYTINGTPYITVFQDGNYDATRLYTAITTALQTNSGSSGFSCTYDNVTGRLAITVPNGFTFTITRANGTSNANYTYDRHDYSNAADRFLALSGLISNSGIAYTNVSFEAVDPINLFGPSNVHFAITGIDIKALSNFPGNPQIIASVPRTSGYGGQEFYSPSSPIVFEADITDLAMFSLQCFDDLGQTIHVPPNTDLTIKMVFIQQNIS